MGLVSPGDSAIAFALNVGNVTLTSLTLCRTRLSQIIRTPRRTRQVLYCEWIAGDEMANEDAAIQAESATTSSSATRGGDADLMDDEEAPSKSHAHDDGGAIRWPFLVFLVCG